MKSKTIKCQVDTEPAFKYLWFFRGLHGHFRNSNLNFFQKAYFVFVIIVGNFVQVSMFVIQLFFVDNIKQLLNNLPMNITLVACALKFFAFLNMHKELLEMQEYFTQLNKRVINPKHVAYLQGLVTFCRRGLIVICIAYAWVVTSAAINATASNRQVLLFDVWIPYDFHDPAWVYWVTLLSLYLLMLIPSAQNLTNDMSPPIYFILLNGHLEVILERIRSIGWDPDKKQEDNYKDLIKCIEDHCFVLKIFDIMQRAVSVTVFLQFASTAFVLSMEALLLLMYPPNLTESLLLLFFFVDGTMQILPCCYYADEFLSVTDCIVGAIYSSNFPDQSAKYKKVAIIFMQMTQKPKVVMAGKIIPVNLATFASIMKLSYSMLALANKLR